MWANSMNNGKRRAKLKILNLYKCVETIHPQPKSVYDMVKT